jgi:hypothetical protein
MGKTIHTEEGDINICNVKFDDKLKPFIKKMREDNVSIYEQMKNCLCTDTLQQLQYKLREYIKKNINELSFSGKKIIINQEYFALILFSVSSYENKDSYDDCYKEFGLLDDRFNFNLNFRKTENESSLKQNFKHKFKKTMDIGRTLENEIFDFEKDYTGCVCGHNVSNINTFILQNNITKYNVLIGCDCINKYKILTKEELKEYLKNRKEQIKQKIKEQVEKRNNEIQQERINIINKKNNEISKLNQALNKISIVYKSLYFERWKQIIKVCFCCKNIISTALYYYKCNKSLCVNCDFSYKNDLCYNCLLNKSFLIAS